jgi:phosphonate transport system substrate-binding protein
MGTAWVLEPARGRVLHTQKLYTLEEAPTIDRILHFIDNTDEGTTIMVHRKNIAIFIIIFILFSLVACTQELSVSPTPTNPSVDPSVKYPIVLGDISDDPAEVIEGTQPLANYLATNLVEFGITEGQVRIATTTDEMAQLLASGEVDLYFDSVYPATLISDKSGAQPVLRRWRFGVAEYQTVIFASIDSGIISIDELAGNIIAFDSPYSTSGFLLPAVYLTETGLNLVGKRSYNDPVSVDELGFVFSYDDENTLQWVLSGLVMAGATDDYNFDVAFPASVKDELIVLARTESVPRQVVVVRSDLDPELLDIIVQILTTAHQTEEGRAALEPFQTTKFDEFPEGIEATGERMREMIKVLQDIPLP